MRTTHLPSAPPAPRLSAVRSESSAPVRVLVVDDEPALRKVVERVLQDRGFVVDLADSGATGIERLLEDPPDVVLLDYLLPDTDGLQVLRRVKEVQPDVEVIVMTGLADVDTAVSAMKAGAHNFLRKPLESNDGLALSVAAAAEHRRLSHRARTLELQLKARERYGELIGTSRGMLDVYRVIDGVSTTNSTILVLGESGTGKELVARAIHANSPRRQGPLVAVNCAAIPRDLVESELFGHVRGAFTGAVAPRAGLFETAHGGTLLLDEVGDLPPPAQVSLLRALESGQIKRVGSDETRTVDVRVIAATNVDLRAKIESGAFRSDLYYRLNVIKVNLPPLRERGDDVLLLAAHFLSKLAVRLQRPPKELTEDARRALRDYDWPGNVRELENALEHAFVLSRSGFLRALDLPFERPVTAVQPREFAALPMSDTPRAGPPELVLPSRVFDLRYSEAKKQAIALFDEAYVLAAMQRASGNTSEAARRAGLDRSNFRRIVRKAR